MNRTLVDGSRTCRGRAVLRLPQSCPGFRWDQKNDSISYLALTRRFIEDGVYASRRWPPGLTLLFAPLFAAVGPHMLLFKSAMALFGIATWVLVYAWVRRITGDAMLAAASALLVGTSWLLFDFSHRFLAEVPFTFWLMLFLCCAESTAAGWRGRLALAGLVLAGAAVELTRGNGVILVPAIAGTLLVTRSFERVLPGAVRVEPAGRVLLIGALLMPLVAWHVRSARVSYPGFQGGSQVEFVLARHGPETAPAVAGGAARSDRASVRDLARRAYRTLAWGHMFYLPVTAFYPLLQLLMRVEFQTSVGLLIVLPAWIAIAAGAFWIWRVRPLAIWLVGLNVATLLLLPWPDGTHVRYLVPLVPLLATIAAIGMVQLAGRKIAIVLLALLCAVNLWVTLDRARFRADHPYIEPEFGNLVALLPSARAALQPGDRVLVDESVEGVAYALTGAKELPLASALQELDGGRVPQAVFVASPSTPRLMAALQQRLQARPQLRAAEVDARGESRVLRVVTSEF